MKLTIWQRIKKLFGWKPPPPVLPPKSGVISRVLERDPQLAERLKTLYPPPPRVPQPREYIRVSAPPVRARDDGDELDLVTTGIAIGRAMRGENHLDYEQRSPAISPIRAGGGGDFGGAGAEFADSQPWGPDKQVAQAEVQSLFSVPSPTAQDEEESCRRSSYVSPAPEPERYEAPSPPAESPSWDSSSSSSSDSSSSGNDS